MMARWSFDFRTSRTQSLDVGDWPDICVGNEHRGRYTVKGKEGFNVED